MPKLKTEIRDELKKKGLTLYYYSFEDKDKHFAVVYSGKALLFHVLEHEELKSQPDMAVSFLSERDFRTLGNRGIREQSNF